jgi:general secretion pathway protein F
MPAYEYVALDPAGKKIKGSIDAENLRAARQRLRGQGIFPSDIREGMETTSKKNRDVKNIFQSNKIPTKMLAVSTRQLATLLNSGLPLVAALQALTEQSDSPIAKRTFVELREAVEGGAPLAKSLAQFPDSFPRLYINMVASGEASGTLDSVLENLAGYLEAQMELRRRVVSALFYPALMLILCTLVVVGLVVFVVPMIVDIFQKQGAVLPLPTRIMIWISDFMIYYWWLPVLAGFAGVSGFRKYYKSVKGRATVDNILLRLPIFGSIYQKVATARVAGTMGTLVASGVGLLSAMEITRNIIGNVHLQNALDTAKDGVREGRSLARELQKSGRFPSLLSHMIAIGETSGKLEQMLQKAGKTYENEANATLAGIATLIEPFMIIGVGLIVLCVVLSILMPMMDLISVMGH